MEYFISIPYGQEFTYFNKVTEDLKNEQNKKRSLKLVKTERNSFMQCSFKITKHKNEIFSELLNYF